MAVTKKDVKKKRIPVKAHGAVSSHPKKTAAKKAAHASAHHPTVKKPKQSPKKHDSSTSITKHVPPIDEGPIDIFKSLDANPLELPSASPTRHGKSIAPPSQRVTLVAPTPSADVLDEAAVAPVLEQLAIDEPQQPAPPVVAARAPETPIVEAAPAARVAEAVPQPPEPESEAISRPGDVEPFREPDTAPPYDPDNEPPIPYSMTHDQQGLMDAVSPQSNPRLRRRVMVFSGMVIFLSALVAGYAGFALWYNQPEKALADALGNSLKGGELEARGAYIQSARETSSRLTFRYKQAAPASQWVDMDYAERTAAGDSSVAATAIVAPAQVYVRTNAADTLLQLFFGEGALRPAALAEIAQAANKKWVKANESELKAVQVQGASGKPADSLDAQLACTQQIVNKFQNDPAQRKEITTIYAQHRFLRVAKSFDAEMVDGILSNRYAVAIDQQAAANFVAALRVSALYRSIDTCVDGWLSKWLDAGGAAQLFSQYRSVDVWVDVWKHSFTRIRMASADGGDTSSFEVFLRYTDVQPPVLPQGAIDSTKLSGPLSQLFVGTASPPDVTVRCQPTATTRAVQNCTDTVLPPRD